MRIENDSNKEEFHISKEMSDAELMQFIQSVEENDMIVAPSYLKESILQKSKSPIVQLTVETRKVSKNVQLFFYGLKVSAAAAAAITLLVFSTFQKDYAIPEFDRQISNKEWDVTGKIFRGTTELTNKIGSFTDQMFMND